MNTSKYIRKLKTYSYALGKGSKGSKAKIHNNSVLLLFFGRIGDAVMFLDVLEAYKKLYVTRQGKELILGCRNEVWALLKSVCATDNISFFEIHRENLNNSFEYFKQRVDAANQIKPEIVLNLRENHMIENVYVHAIDASYKLVYRVYPIEHTSFWNRYFSEYSYTEDISAPEEMDFLTAQAHLIRHLGMPDYKSIIPLLPKKECNDLPTKNSYVCLCPGASVSNKCWPTERYAEVINYIHENTSMNVAICGGKTEQEVAHQILSQVEDKSRIIDYTGKSTMDEWIALIQRARFVVCNESASTHLAASSQIDAICIGEQKFGDKWLPYRPEIVRVADKIPVMVRTSQMACSFCAKKNFERSDECKECFQTHGIIKCVYEVSATQVMDQIAKLI